MFPALLSKINSYVDAIKGTGTLESALHWLEYMNSTASTFWADQRRKNGHPEPYKVKYIALGNEVWGPWQVGQATAEDCTYQSHSSPLCVTY